ncbi:MAG: hypothetical protein L0Z62_24990 [Gemmataceae bacterium]|nr:hypothetical protein [Gemmataceae bacterium]
MRRFIHLGGLLIVTLALCVPTWAGEDKKEKGKEVLPEKKERGKEVIPSKGDDKNPKKDPETKGKDEPKVKIVLSQYFDGKLSQMDPNSLRNFTVQIKVPEANPDGYQQMQRLQSQLQQQQAQYARARPQDRQNIANQIRNTMNEMVKAKANLVRYKDRDVKLRASEKMLTRSYHPPLTYDDKGNVKQYTQKELKDLKDPGLPGYRTESESLRTGQIVRVYLAKPLAPMKGDKGKGKKIEDDELVAQDRPEVVVIMILAEPMQK